MATRQNIQQALRHPYELMLFAKEVMHPVFGSRFKLMGTPSKPPVIPTKSESSVIKQVNIYAHIKLDDGTDVTCYEIMLQPSVRIEQSKVAIQQYVRKLLVAGQAALINFISPTNKDIWRLTLVAKDSKITGKGIEDIHTHPQRYTYLIEKERSNRTMADRMERLSLEPNLNLEALIQAYSVEAMSKAFFDEYKEHYQNFVEYLTGKRMIKEKGKWVEKQTGKPNPFLQSVFDGSEKDARDFIKKLLGRIVFLYFVQKKRWLGASNIEYEDGPYDFIYKLFEETGGDERFFPFGLTELFFNVLNKKRNNDDWKTPGGVNVKIPYLNGGLFNRDLVDEMLHKKADMLTFPPHLFSDLDKSEVPFKRGFLDFLNAFNFTVYEDSHDDHTVAVDPEMLGHIFENLLEDNKDKGAFYTPKEIVHYMCQESLVEYLTTHLGKEFSVYRQLNNDQFELFGNESRKGQLKMIEDLGDKALNRTSIEQIVKDKNISDLTKSQLKRIGNLLDEVKICDPAIGSGAFPMGLLQEIFGVKEAIAYELGLPWEPAREKENIIQNSIYGVDIEKGAVDIARLRFWLSLVVDEEKPKALPNLDYKIVVGNSLVSKFEDEVIEIDWDIEPGKQFEMFGNEQVMKRQDLLYQISKKQQEFFDPENGKEKSALKQKIRNLKIEILINQLELMINVNGLADEPKRSNFSNTGKYNQAYENYLQTKGWQKTIDRLKVLKKDPEKTFEHFDWKLDFPEVLNPIIVGDNGGFDIVIANPPYVDIKGLPKEEAKMLFERFSTTSNRINLYSIFLEKGWELGNNSSNLIYINPNSLLLNSSYRKIRQLLLPYVNKLIKLPDDVFANAIVETMIIQACRQNSSTDVEGAFYRNDEEIDFNRLKFKRFLRKDWIQDSESRFNIFVSPEVLSIITTIDKDGNKNVGDYFDFSLGITPYDSYKGHSKELIESREYHSKQKKDETYVPLISGKNITKYCVNPSIEEYLKYGPWLGAPRQKKFFTRPRTIVRQIISGSPPSIYAGYTEDELYHTQIGFSIISKKDKISPKILCALLNSHVINFYHFGKFLDPQKQTFQKILIENCKQFPIPKSLFSIKVARVAESLVDYILFLKIQPFTEAKDKLMPVYFEQVIDGVVYELYFPELLKKHNREIIKHLGELPEFKKEMSDDKKMSICNEVFTQLNDKKHPIRNNLFYLDSIPEIAIIEGKHENN